MRLSSLFGLLAAGGLVVAGSLFWKDGLGRSAGAPRSAQVATVAPPSPGQVDLPDGSPLHDDMSSACERRMRELVLNASGASKKGNDALAALVTDLDAAFTDAERGSCQGKLNDLTLRNLRAMCAASLLYAARVDFDDGRHARAKRRRERALYVIGDADPALKRALIRDLSLGLAMQAREAKADADTRRRLAEEAIEVWADNQLAHQLRSTACEALNDLTCALEAAEALKKLAPALGGLDNRIEKLGRQVQVEGEFDDVRSTHFVARFEGLAAERAGYAALNILERAFIRVGDRLDRRPDEQVTVVIYTGAQYQKSTLAPDWTGGIFDGKIRLREGDLLREGGKLESVLFHEYTHALLARTVRGQLPIWLHEGLAQAMEPEFSVSRARQVIARQGRVLELPSLTGSFMGIKDRAVVGLAYAQSAVMVDALLTRQSAHGLRRLFQELEDGAAFDDAFKTVFYKTPDAFWQEQFGS